MKDANRSTHLNRDIDRLEGAQPEAPQTGKNPRDARAPEAPAHADESKLRENRDALNVDESHRTPAMEKGKRGSYP